MLLDCVFRGGIRGWVNVSPKQDGRTFPAPAGSKKPWIAELRLHLYRRKTVSSPRMVRSGILLRAFLPLPPLPEAAIKNPQTAETRLQYLEQMFQASPDGLSIADSAHRVLWANETFVRMFDYAAAEVVGQSLENLVVPPDRLAESRWVSEALARGERITLETKRRKKDGALLDVSVSCAPLLLDGKMAGFYAGYHDISDRKRVEALSSALYRVAEKSSSAHDLQQFFAAVHSIVDELMYARNFYIALYDPSTEVAQLSLFRR